jgi:hypothetical protein
MISRYQLLNRDIDKHLDGWINHSSVALQNLRRFDQAAAEAAMRRALEHDAMINLLRTFRNVVQDDRSPEQREEDEQHEAYYSDALAALTKRIHAHFKDLTSG